MNVDNHLHLEVRDILQRIKDAIDNEALWTKHYKNLREIEKDLPASAKQDEVGKNVEMPDSLYKLNISDFLRLEQKTYPDKGDTVGHIISKIEQLSIPGVFNFRERLKLTLCAACHINTLPVYRDTNFNVMVGIFKQLNLIEFESNATSKSEQSTNHEQNANNKISVLINKKDEIIENHKKYEKNLEDYNNMKRDKAGPISRVTTRSQIGGDITQNINVDSIFEHFNKRGTDPITAFRKEHKKIISTGTMRGSGEMYKYLDEISFNARNIQSPELLDTLKKEFKLYVTRKINNLGLIDENFLNILEKKIDEMKITDFSLYLKKYYFFGIKGLKIDTGNNNKKIDVDALQFEPLSLFVSQPEQTSGNNGVEEKKQEDETDAKLSKDIFGKYIHKLFQNMYIYLIFDNNIIKIIDGEIKELKNEEKHEGRKKNIQERIFDEAGNPLLMMFLLFVRDCVHTMSQKIISDGKKDDFWHQLEESIGNGIRLDDETLQCKNEGNETSLFAYLQEQLKKSEEEKGEEGEEGEEEEARKDRKDRKDRKIKFLIVIAKLIYLLQNYHYF
tara:strand:- start:73 stop:1752 length:1680 start_codon:yes stop_codon:yes gene_type:complete